MVPSNWSLHGDAQDVKLNAATLNLRRRESSYRRANQDDVGKIVWAWGRLQAKQDSLWPAPVWPPWHGTLNKVLRIAGLIEAIADLCVYTDRDRSTFVLVYVDDILIFSKNQQNEQRIKETLSKAFRTKDLGEAKFCLGIVIHSSHGEQRNSQRSYIKDVLQRFNINECKPVGTPLSTSSRLPSAIHPKNPRKTSLTGSSKVVKCGNNFIV